MPGPRGFDGAKKVNGVKRHVVVDTLGLLVAVVVTAASLGDRHAFGCVVARAKRVCPRLEHLWADQGYRGAVVAAFAALLGVAVELTKVVRPVDGRVSPRRWVVERTFSWMHRCRRLARQYEQTPRAHEAMVQVS